MPKTESDHSTRPRRSSKRRLFWLGIATSPIWLGLVALAYLQHSVNDRVRSAIAEADRDDPNWRLADLEAHRLSIPPDRNSAHRARTVIGLIPGSRFAWNVRVPRTESLGPPTGYDLYDLLEKLEPDAPIPPVLAAALRDQLPDCAEALEVARPMADMGEGAIRLKYDIVWIATILPHIQDSRNVARLLHLDAIARAEAGEGDGAVDSCRGILGVARSIGDEPIIISQLVRMANDRIALEAVERVLARGVASDRTLKKLQDDLAREADWPFLLIGIRGERAGMFDLMEKISSGEIPTTSLRGLTGTDADAYLHIPMQFGVFNRYNEGLILEYLNRGARIARRPVGEQPALWEEWERATAPGGGLAKYTGILAHTLKGSLKSASVGQTRTVAGLRAAVVAVASERFRIARGRWPDRLDELVPSFLDSLPEDPYLRQSLHLGRQADGIVVYAVGDDLKDDGGKFDRKQITKAGTDVGLRLWDVDHRRRSAPELPSDPFRRENP